MAMFHGKNGKVVWNAEDGVSDVDIQHVTSWSFDAVADIADATQMGSTNWKEFLGGFSSWTATVECNADSAGPDVPLEANDSIVAGAATQGLGGTFDDSDADPQEKVHIELWFTQAAAGGLLYGPAIATGISVSTDINDVAKVTYTFQGNGQAQFTTTEPTY